MTQPGPDDADAERLIELLRRRGATEEEIAATGRYDRGALALELVLRDGRAPIPVDDLIALLDTDREQVERFWQALGLDPAAMRAVPATLADAQQVLSGTAVEWLGEESALALARVIGTATSRLAEAVVDAFRVGFELPELAGGMTYSEVVERYGEITREALPAFEAMMVAVFRAHLVRTAATQWTPSPDGSGTRRELAVGFADLVGYTALTRTLPPGELGPLLRRFEELATDVLARHGARMVKQIGDGIMFTATDAPTGAAVGLELAETFRASDVVPPVRVGLACGNVLTQYGDYFGDTVNLAARLVALANPGTVVVSAQVAGQIESAGWRVQRLPDQALKGFGAPAAVYRLLGPASQAE